MTVVAIVGTVGVPAKYGGFETLAENLVRYHQEHAPDSRLLVYCSGRGNVERRPTYLGAELHYVSLPANGIGSIVYDIVSLVKAVREQSDRILLLGVSGAIALPFVRIFSRARVITNIDGIEWRRAKWRGPARWFLHFSEWMAVRFSHVVIADNDAIALHSKQHYNTRCEVIPYGGDHALTVGNSTVGLPPLPHEYALSICRIEPENNVEMVLEAFALMADRSIIFVGNWESNQYAKNLKARFSAFENIFLIGPVYDEGALYALRAGASLYVHGHSAGGTNPSLVEIMHFGCPVLAYDCVFNRSTTEGHAPFFQAAGELRAEVESLEPERALMLGDALRDVARRRYTWKVVGASYFRLLHDSSASTQGMFR